MTIVVNTHNAQEERELVNFLERMKYDYSKEENLLSEEQLAEILERDREYEAGNAEFYSLEEIKAHFNIKK